MAHCIWIISLVKAKHMPGMSDWCSQPMDTVDNEKDLVITDNKLNFRKHIAYKVCIANRNLGIIFRIFTYLSQDMIMALYKAIVRPYVEFTSVVWSLLYKKGKLQFENIQHSATCLVPSLKELNYSERLGIPLFEYRGERPDDVEVCKILNNIHLMNKDRQLEQPASISSNCTISELLQKSAEQIHVLAKTSFKVQDKTLCCKRGETARYCTWPKNASEQVIE